MVKLRIAVKRIKTKMPKTGLDGSILIGGGTVDATKVVETLQWMDTNGTWHDVPTVDITNEPE